MKSIIKTTSKSQCPVCGNKGEIEHEGLKDQLFGAHGDWTIRRCSNKSCELRWLDPCPVEEDIAQAYQTYYTHADNEEKSLIKSRCVAFIRDFLVNIVISLCGQRREREDVRHMYLRNVPPGRILDIGCGDARFLNRMKQSAWDVLGIDFDPAAASNAKNLFGIDVRVGRLEDMQFPECTFDAVTMNHVIEHVFNPVDLLTEVRKILKPGGRLVMVTPNPMGMGHRVFGRFWRGLEPPRHIQIFTPPSLEAVAKSAGLRVDNVFTTAVNAWIILSASFPLMRFSGPAGRDNAKPKRSEQFRALKMQIAEAWSLRTHCADGEETVLIATKNDAG